MSLHVALEPRLVTARSLLALPLARAHEVVHELLAQNLLRPLRAPRAAPPFSSRARQQGRFDRVSVVRARLGGSTSCSMPHRPAARARRHADVRSCPRPSGGTHAHGLGLSPMTRTRRGAVLPAPRRRHRRPRVLHAALVAVHRGPVERRSPASVPSRRRGSAASSRSCRRASRAGRRSRRP